MTSRSAIRSQRKKDAKQAKASLNTPVVATASHIGVCIRCDREGWVNDEGICVGLRSVAGSIAGFEQRSKRCDDIFDAKDLKERKRDAGRTQR